jgi:hypothetical protein
MENILSQFNAGNLDIKLTSEKLFINTPASSETFALRSVNGIGVIDLVDEYNKALTIWKQTPITTYVAYILFALGGIWLLQNILYIFYALEKSPVDIVLGIIFDIAIIGVGYFLIKYCKNKKPILMSAVRIMISGGVRDFQFDKTSIDSENIAKFVAKVESTLTAYHKNND